MKKKAVMRQPTRRRTVLVGYSLRRDLEEKVRRQAAALEVSRSAYLASLIAAAPGAVQEPQKA